MNTTSRRTLICGVLGTLAVAFSPSARAASAEVRIEVNKPTVPLSPHLYGLFFEDINYGADGGLYAELVQNRSFEYYPWDHGVHGKSDRGPLFAWEKIERDGGRAEISAAKEQPLHANNPNYLELKITKPGAAGVSNSGFWGFPIQSGATYDVSLFARTLGGWSGDASVTVSLEMIDGASAGSVTLSGIGSNWGKLEGILTATKTAADARLIVTTPGKGTLALDMISLFPQETWAGRKNGLRKDLVQAIKDLNPKFLRFPGGCIAHGLGLDNLYRWKDSVGPVEKRKPNFNLWGYYQSYGLGYYEYFLLCEDLGMAALPVVPVGVSCGFRGLESVPMDQLQPHIQDALDLIEFANGPVASKWGAVRAEMGHPEPFDMEFISLGNEEHDTPEVRERFPLFVDAVRAKYPEIKIIGTSGLGPDLPLYDLMTKLKVYSSDEHYYERPDWFIRNQHRFDDFDRNKPKIFVGEYASTGNTLFNALSEAAYLTGIERNGDIVDMTCYAPLFARNEVGGWRPDLIFFDNRQVMLTPNYHVQQLFGRNKGDVYLANTFEVKDAWKPTTITGGLGIGSWSSAIEVEQLAVNGRKLDVSKWKSTGGNFRMTDGKYVQSDSAAKPAISLGPETYSGETVTFTARARKTAGAEGFLVRFGADKDGKGGYWWNAGGWGNTRHALEEIRTNGTRGTAIHARGSIETGRWYDLKVVMSPGRVQCFVDEKQVLEYTVSPAPLSVASTFDKAVGEVILKLVNPSPVAIDTRIILTGANNVAPKGSLISLSGTADAVNTFEKPNTIQPVTSEIVVSKDFTHRIPPMAVEFIRLKAK